MTQYFRESYEQRPKAGRGEDFGDRRRCSALSWAAEMSASEDIGDEAAKFELAPSPMPFRALPRRFQASGG